MHPWRGGLHPAGCSREVACIRRLYWRGGLHQTAVLKRWPASMERCPASSWLYWRGGLHQTAVLKRWPASMERRGGLAVLERWPAVLERWPGCNGEVACSIGEVAWLYWRGGLAVLDGWPAVLERWSTVYLLKIRHL